ncbi:MAG: FxsA family protein [Candidatus Omnitrophota bacterium]|nr:MAG: FxsA family protein [Candidatus Omnitrophota bacterium]
MLGYLILLFTTVPLLELALLIKIGQVIGASLTIAIVVITGAGGAMLARSQGLKVFNRINQDLAAGVMPQDALFDALLILCGGLLLITPGVLTDLVGLFLLIPFFRDLIKVYIKKKIRKAFDEGRVIRFHYFNRY